MENLSLPRLHTSPSRTTQGSFSLRPFGVPALSIAKALLSFQDFLPAGASDGRPDPAWGSAIMNIAVHHLGGKGWRHLYQNPQELILCNSQKLGSLCVGPASFPLAKLTDKDTSGSQRGKLLRLCLLNHIPQFDNKAAYF